MVVYTWRVSDCTGDWWWDTNQLPVQSVIRTSVVKKQSRLGSQFPGDCMGKLILNPYEGTFKKVANQQILGNAGGSAES